MWYLPGLQWYLPRPAGARGRYPGIFPPPASRGREGTIVHREDTRLGGSILQYQVLRVGPSAVPVGTRYSVYLVQVYLYLVPVVSGVYCVHCYLVHVTEAVRCRSVSRFNDIFSLFKKGNGTVSISISLKNKTKMAWLAFLHIDSKTYLMSICESFRCHFTFPYVKKCGHSDAFV